MEVAGYQCICSQVGVKIGLGQCKYLENDVHVSGEVEYGWKNLPYFRDMFFVEGHIANY